MRALALAALLACNPPATRDVAPAAPVAVPPEPACAAPPATALAYLADRTCPWVLVPEAGALALRELAPAGGRVLAVVPPEDCERCSYTGSLTDAGPVLLAVREGGASAMPEAVFVGAALGGPTLRFAPLWFGPSAVGDATRLGPSHALAPWLCGQTLVLAPAARLPGAQAEEPGPAVLAAAGAYAVEAEALRRRAPLPDLQACTRVPLELP
jgi:hypothetical protein